MSLTVSSVTAQDKNPVKKQGTQEEVKPQTQSKKPVPVGQKREAGEKKTSSENEVNLFELTFAGYLYANRKEIKENVKGFAKFLQENPGWAAAGLIPAYIRYATSR